MLSQSRIGYDINRPIKRRIYAEKADQPGKSGTLPGAIVIQLQRSKRDWGRTD
jgi:hypothetical protein